VTSSASAAVAEMGGHVAKKLGDGLVALFGYPLAHENDAERAAQAALLIQRELAELNAKNVGIGKPELSIRVGLGSARCGGRDLRRCSQNCSTGAGTG